MQLTQLTLIRDKLAESMMNIWPAVSAKLSPKTLDDLRWALEHERGVRFAVRVLRSFTWSLMGSPVSMTEHRERIKANFGGPLKGRLYRTINAQCDPAIVRLFVRLLDDERGRDICTGTIFNTMTTELHDAASHRQA